jgi:hypothetical protein
MMKAKGKMKINRTVPFVIGRQVSWGFPTPSCPDA